MVESLSERKTRVIIATLLCLSPIVGMAVDLIAPSLPGIAADLRVSDAAAKGAIAIYLLGYALGNFVTGFLTDALGRQKLLRIGLFLFIIFSLLPVVFPDISVLLLTRLLQGITLGGVAVIVRSIYSDILPPEKLIRLGTLMAAMWGIGPVIGPVLGGYLQFYFGWKAAFVFFSSITLLALIPVWMIIPETHFNRHPLNFKVMKENLTTVFSHREFMTLVLLMGLSYSLIIGFHTAGPFLIQTQLHYSPVFYGHFALFLGIIFLISTLTCRFFLKYFNIEQIFQLIIPLFSLIALISVIISYFLKNSVGLIAVASALMFFASAFIFPLSMGKGLSLFRPISGTAGATMFLINILITSLTSFIIGFIHIQTVNSLLWLYFALMVMILLIYFLLFKRTEQF